MAGDVAMARLLLKHRPNVDIAAQVLGQRDDDPFGLRGSGLDVRNGETPLHAALRAGNREMVLALRRHRTDRHEAEALDHQAFVRSLRRQRECNLELSAMDRERCFWARLGVARCGNTCEAIPACMLESVLAPKSLDLWPVVAWPWE